MAVTLLKCKPDKFSPGSMSDGTNPSAVLLLARAGFVPGGKHRQHGGVRDVPLDINKITNPFIIIF